MSDKSKPWVQCPNCMGHGTIPLSDTYSEVLDVLKKHSELSTLDILKRFKDVKPTAMNNRMVFLMKHDLVSRKRLGKSWIWRAK